MKFFTTFLIIASFNLALDAQIKLTLDTLSVRATRAFDEGNVKAGTDLAQQLFQRYSEEKLPPDTTSIKLRIAVAQAAQSQRNEAGAIVNYRKAQAFFERTSFDLSDEKFQVNKGLAHSYKRTSQLDSAVIYSQRAIQIGNEYYGHTHKNLHDVYNNLGNTYRLLGEFDNALQSHDLALNIRKKEFAEGNFRVGDSHNNIALVYHDLFSFSKAMIYYKEALQYYQGESTSLVYRQALVNYNIARIHYDLGDYDQGLNKVQRAVQIMDDLDRTNYGIYYEMLTLKTNCLAELGKFDEAEKLLSYTIEKKNAILPPDHLNWNYTYTAAAIVAAKQENYLLAEKNLNKSLAILKSNYDFGHPEIVQLYNGLCGYALQMNDLDALQEYILEMETQLTPANGVARIIADEQKLVLNFRRAEYADLKFENLQEIADLDTAIQRIEEAIAALSRIRKSGTEQQNRLFIADNHQYLVEKAANLYLKKFGASNEISFAEKALEILDQNKSSLLKDAVRNNSTAEFAEIPISIRQEEIALKNQLANVKESMASSTEAISKMDVNEYESGVLAFDKFLLQLENEYPRYYNFFYRDQTINIAELEEIAGQNELTFLEFYVSKASLTCFSIDANGLQVVTKKIKEEELGKIITELRRAIANMKFGEALDEFLNPLYLNLVKDFLPATATGKLVIIPDKNLFQLPFEILREAEHSEFLIEQHAVSYAYSLGLWQMQSEQENKSSLSTFAGFAPNYRSSDLPTRAALESQPIALLLRSEAQPLPGALQAVEAIAELTGGNAQLGAQATEAAFKKMANEYRIFHCAVHAISDSNDPLAASLIFQPTADSEDDQLTVREIYRMKFNADLAVLSACNSGWGKINNAEGMQSIGYAFAYSGIPSNVMSLWKVPDEATATIMQSFYKYLMQGTAKDVALQKAKVDFLKYSVDPAQKNPLFWAGFVINGNTSPIDLQSHWSPWSLLLVLVLLIASLWLFYRSR